MPIAIAEYLPGEIFEAFLYEQNSRKRTEWQRFDKRVHRAFYKAKQEFPEIMIGYDDFLIRTEPHSHILEIIFHEFRQSRILTSIDGKVIIGDAKLLKEPDKKLKKVVEYICNLL